MASTEDRANKHLPKAFVETYKIFKKLTGIPQETQFVLSTSLHNAYTNSKQVCFGPEWVDSAIPENFHGFGSDVATVQSMNQFVIAHEVGHLSIQPHWSTSWGKEIRSWPINLSRQGMWSNVYSDVLVNTHIFKARDWMKKPKNEDEEQIAELMEWSQRWHMTSRICEHTNEHGKLRAAGTLPDNRFTPPSGTIGAYSPHESGDPFTPIPGKTPLYQIRQGHGRGFQVYPPMSYACAKNMDAKYRQVNIKHARKLFHCPNCDEVMGDTNCNGVTCLRCQGSVNAAGSISPGTYEVTKTWDLEGKVNNPLPTFPHYVEINGQKVPFYYTQELCPDCGKNASCDLVDGFGAIDTSGGVDACSEQSTLWRILVMLEYAGFRALTTGHRGKTGYEAGHQFLKEVAMIAHHAESVCLLTP